jgi:uncharacterized protein
VKRIQTILIGVLTALSLVVLRAQPNCIPDKPSPAKLLNNFSAEAPDLLSPSQRMELENKLEAFSKNTSNQLVVVIVDDLCGYSANEYATALGKKWGVGQGKFDNGIVLLIKPTGGKGQRNVYLAVGYGLEGAIPDITAKKIIQQEIIPRFKQGAYYEGIDAAADVLISLAQKEYSYKDYNQTARGIKGKDVWIGLMIVLVMIVMAYKNSRRYSISRRGRTFYGAGFGGFGGGSGWGGGSGGGFGGSW